jgi:hypothetical protein
MSRLFYSPGVGPGVGLLMPTLCVGGLTTVAEGLGPLQCRPRQ